jgi:hypothetical protein
MAYNNAIPTATDPLKVSQAQILANFQEILTYFSVNHVGFGILDQGKHAFLQMPRQGAAPATGATEVALYSVLGASSAVTELAFRRENNGTIIPFTEGTNATQGWCRLPSGLVMKWNTVTVSAVNAAANVISTMPLIGPALTTAFWAIVVPQADPALVTKDVDAACYVTALASNQISYKIWQRSLANSPGTPSGPLNINGLLLGVE